MKKNKLLSLLLITCLTFVGCSNQATEEQTVNSSRVLVSDVADVEDNINLEIDELVDTIQNANEIDDDVTNVTNVTNEDINSNSQSTNTTETTIENNTSSPNEDIKTGDVVTNTTQEPVVEVLEAYVEADNDSIYSLSYNLTNNIDIESHVFDQVNELREELGIAPLTTNNILVGAAYTRAKELPSLFSHSRPDGRDWYTVFEEIPYDFKACGENLTTGSGLNREQAYNKIFDSWYNSAGHYANMVNPDFKEIGIAVYFDDNGTYYATQIFGTEF